MNLSKTEIKSLGFSLVEVTISIGIGGVLLLGMLYLGNVLSLSTKVVRETSDFNALRSLITIQLLKMGSNCGGPLGYFPTSLNGPINTSPNGQTNLTLLNELLPNPALGISPSQIRIKPSGTVINGSTYFLRLTTIDNRCTGSGSCTGTLTLVMNAPSSPGVLVAPMTADLTHITFRIDSNSNLASCTNAGAPSNNNAVNYGSANCTSFPLRPPQVAGKGAWATCPPSTVAVQACTVQTDGTKSIYCSDDSSAQITSSLACCPLSDSAPIVMASSSTPRPGPCCLQDEALTGICSSDFQSPNFTSLPATSQCPGQNQILCTKLTSTRLSSSRVIAGVCNGAYPPTQQPGLCHFIWKEPGTTTGGCSITEVMVGVYPYDPDHEAMPFACCSLAP